MRFKTPHLSVHKGKRVLVLLRNGERIISKFIEKTKNGKVILEDREIPGNEIRSLSIYRNS